MNLAELLFLSTVFARTFIVFVVLVIGIRLFGKRNAGEMNILDLAMVLLIGNAIQNAITYGSGQLGVGLVSAATLLVLDQVLGRIFVRFPKVEDVIIGKPVILFIDGRFDKREMRRQGISENKVRMAARKMGLSQMKDVRMAVLEEDGQISIIPKNQQGKADNP
jgi:uncharacterized membrane protein YcaP (DUF421 family)